MTLVVEMRDWPLDAWIARLAEAMPERRVLSPREASEPAGVSYVATWNHRPGALARYPNLRAIFSLGAGVDHIFRDPDLPDAPIVRVVDPDLTMRMSEWVALHVLIHHRSQRMYDWQQSERIWADDREQPAAREVRVGVLGLGELGRDAAGKLAALGFDVAGWSRRPRDIAGIAGFSGEEHLAGFLARTDILVCMLPLTPATRGILNMELFRGLARDGRLGGPIVLNAGRGGLQREDDILAALDEGVLKAVTLDVFETEPLPANSPLWTHPRVTITPHNSAISHPGAVAAYVARQIAAHEAGGAFANVVDRASQY